MVPKLSFFKDQEIRNSNWVSVCFGDVVSKVSKKHKPSDGVMNCIQLEHISQETGELLGHTCTDKVQSVSTLFTKNHILYSKLRPYLKKYWYAEFNGTCTGEIWVLKAEKINSRFLYFVIQTDQFTETANISSGSKMPRADWNLVAKYRFHAPSFKEQQKIASFLSSVDEKISQLEKKKTLLETYKRGIMQKVFSQELRFKDENGQEFPKWEDFILNDIGETYQGLTGKTKENFGEGKLYIQYMQIFSKNIIDISQCGRVQINEGEKQSKVQYGDVLFTTSSETPKEVGYPSVFLDSNREVYLNSFSFGFRPKDDNILYPMFSAFLFRSQTFRKSIVKLAQGSTRYNMSKKQMLKLIISVPVLKEQQKIASFLSSIDNKIEITSTQLEKTREFKKGLLQQMFV